MTTTKPRVLLPQKPASPPYWAGLLGLIPLIGFFIGLWLTISGIFRYKDKILTIIGLACMFFTVFVYYSLYDIGVNSEVSKKGLERHNRVMLNNLVINIEYYKMIHQEYPESLQQVRAANETVIIFDMIQTMQKRKDKLFHYKKQDSTYTLFSVGRDGIAGTADDIYPGKVEKVERVSRRK